MAPECKDQTKRLWEIGDESLLIATVKKMIETYSIDSTRVLLTGFSQGGVYTYTFGLRNPSVFSAIAPVCGALVARPSTEGERILEQACGVPVYIVHGALDDRIPVERARASRDRLEKAGYRVVYRELPQLGHTNPAEESDRIWAWFKGITGQPAAGTK
jgi:phospholipase/carboxylesterase